MAIDAVPEGNTPLSIPAVDSCVTAEPGTAMTVDVVATGIRPELVIEAAMVELVFDPDTITVTDVDYSSGIFGPDAVAFITYHEPTPGQSKVDIQAAAFFGPGGTGTTSMLLFRIELVYHGSDEGSRILMTDTRDKGDDGYPGLYGFIDSKLVSYQIGSVQFAEIVPPGVECTPPTPTPAPPTPALEELEPGKYFKLNERRVAIIPLDVSREGLVVGSYDAPGYHSIQPFVWELGMMRVLPLPELWSGGAAGVNDAGQIAGWGGPGGSRYHAVIWRDYVPEYLEVPCDSARALDINNDGNIVGECIDPSQNRAMPFRITSEGFEFLDVGVLTSDTVGLSQNLVQINDAGLILISAGGKNIIVDGDDVIDLGPAAPWHVISGDVNEHGQVAVNLGQEYTPFLWQGGILTPLNIPPDPHVIWKSVSAIDDDGRVSSGLHVVDGDDVIDLRSVLPSPIRDEQNYIVGANQIIRFTDTGYFLIYGWSGSIVRFAALVICLPDLHTSYATGLPRSSQGGCPTRESISATPTPTPTPTVAAATEVPVTPTPTAEPQEVVIGYPPGGVSSTASPAASTSASAVWGDLTCDEVANGLDAVVLLMYLAGTDKAAASVGCTPIGLSGVQMWGDFNCDGRIDEGDLLAILRAIGGLTHHSGDERCPTVGSTFG